MLRTRAVVLSLVCLTLLFSVQAAFGGSRSWIKSQQQSPALIVEEDVKRAIELYQRGDDKAAVESLRRVVKAHKNDVAAWHFLALSYERQGKSKDARKAHEQATKAGEVMMDVLFASLSSKETVDQEQLKLLLVLAAESADKYLKLTSNPSKSKVQEWNSLAESFREYATISASNVPGGTPGKIYKPAEVTTKARVLQRRDEPQYTEEARKNGIAGTVVLRAVIAFDGKLRAIRVVSGLPYGLTQNSIEAARKIKFAPALLNGQPVSQYIQIEYNFNLF